jgi:hypothetical protein
VTDREGKQYFQVLISHRPMSEQMQQNPKVFDDDVAADALLSEPIGRQER